MVETFLLPLGPRLVEACGIGPGMRVLDVAAGTGNASIPAAQAGADVTASDLTPELLEAGRRRAEAEGLELEWVEGDAENLPFEDASFDVVMSAIGVMFAPHRQEAAGRAGPRLPSWRHSGPGQLDSRGHARGALRDDEAVRGAASAWCATAAAVGE
jgi:SAM-dependent methyltransferase